METAKLTQKRTNKIAIKDPAKMTKEEFYAKINKAIKQAEQGKVTRVKYEDISKYLGLE